MQGKVNRPSLFFRVNADMGISRLKVAIAGATGYTGGELLRLLTQHPHVEVVMATSEQSAGEPLIKRLPFLTGYYELSLKRLDPVHMAKASDLVFMALSHTQGMDVARHLLDAGKKVIDLSADYRLYNPETYEKWYGARHTQPELIKKAVYGLPEVYRDKISKGSLIANPGCYPTAALLPLYPFLKGGHVDMGREIIIDAKSGVSGAGRTPTEKTHFCEAHDGMTAYSIGMHRHLPEIEQEMVHFGRRRVKAIFTPHLMPVNRGILSTIYLPLNRKFSEKRVQSVLNIYRGEPFIRQVNDPPNISHVKGTNFCDISAHIASRGRMVILVSAIDNLVKGAAGQAIQNMNIMMGWDERLGLLAPGLFP